MKKWSVCRALRSIVWRFSDTILGHPRQPQNRKQVGLDPAFDEGRGMTMGAAQYARSFDRDDARMFEFAQSPSMNLAPLDGERRRNAVKG